MVGVEQRVHTRYEIAHAVELTRADVTIAGQMHNLSRGGTLVSADMEPRLRVGERMTVSFRLPDLESPIACQAEVRWVSDVDPKIVGLQFVTGLRAKETWALGRFLERAEAGELP